MIEAFITKHGGIYPFKHIACVYPGIVTQFYTQEQLHQPVQ